MQCKLILAIICLAWFGVQSNTVKVADYAAVRTGAVPEFVYGVLDFMNHVLLISGENTCGF